METTKMNFVQLRKSMVNEILSIVKHHESAEWCIVGLWMEWKELRELYHNESLFWCVSDYTQATYHNLPEDLCIYRLVCKITRIDKQEYDVEVIKVAD